MTNPDYYTFHMAFQGKNMFLNNRKIEKYQAYQLMINRGLTIDDVMHYRSGFAYADKEGWCEGHLIRHRELV